MLTLHPVTFDDAAAFIRRHHRHHLPPQGWKWGVAVHDGERTRGVITVGRPVARKMDDGLTLEVTRCCTDGAKNACTKLYGAARRAAAALGYTRLLTCTGAAESGASLRAAGFRVLRETPGRSWSVPTRPRDDSHELGPRTVWILDLGNGRPDDLEPIAPPADAGPMLFG